MLCPLTSKIILGCVRENATKKVRRQEEGKVEKESKVVEI